MDITQISFKDINHVKSFKHPVYGEMNAFEYNDELFINIDMLLEKLGCTAEDIENNSNQEALLNLLSFIEEQFEEET